MANQNIHQGYLNDHSIRPTWGTIEKQDDTNKEDRFIAIVESISKTVANKADAIHIHDDRYYTEDEIDAIIAGVDSRIQNVDDLELEIDELAQDLDDTKTEINDKIRDLYANKADNNHTHPYLPLTGGTLSNALTVQTGGIVVQGGSSAGGNNTRLNLTSGMPDAFPYNQSKRGTKIYSNGIAFADPFNGNSNNDAGWVRHIEESGNSGTLEIAVGDDGNESVVVRQYNTSSAVVRTLTLLDGSGNSLFPGSLTMSGEINTSFKGAVAIGSRAANAGTVPNLVAEVRYSSGTMGSVSLSAYTSGSITIPAGWYNYLYIPHRSGGKNGAANQDNHNYGTLLLFGMTMDTNPFIIRVASGGIAAIRKITVTTS